MKVTIDGMTFEGSEDEIEKVVKRYRPDTMSVYASPPGQPRGSNWPEEPTVIGLRPGRVV